MPRASGSGKRQSGGGHRDSRHDNAAAASGKKGSARKSLPSAAATNAATAPAGHNKTLDNADALATASSSPHCVHHHHANGNALSSVHSSAAHVDNQHLAAASATRRASLDAESESSDSFNTVTASHPANGHVNGASPVHRQIDVNFLKNTEVHRDPGFVDMAATVLKVLPVQDTLAILIILMHIPSLSLSIIYAIFACLTFVPPVKTSSGMNLNIAEMFDGNSATPSTLTIVCLDLFFLLIWLFLWQPIQDAVLDLAKPIIAVTLGGATRNDPSFRGIRTGFTWVFMYHIIRGTQSQWIHLVPNMPETWRRIFSDDTPIAYYSKLYSKKGHYAWFRSVLAIHILTQSLTRYVKDWYLRREKAVANPPNPTDIDSAKQAGLAGQLIAPDGTHDANPTSTDAEHAMSVIAPQPSPSPLFLNQSSARKRRKQSAQVRLKQPLWAALASTKIVVVKEYELTRASAESASANAIDIHNLGSAPFDSQPNQIWISYIGSDEICFDTSYFPYPADPEEAPSTPEAPAARSPCRPAGVDASKPFYVKVNHAFWQPTRMHSLPESQDEVKDAARWSGEIYGLRPASKYVCEFVDSFTNNTIFTTTIRTAKEALSSKDGASTSISDNSRSLRPDSPVTTLKTSIEASSEKLAEEKSRLKNARKDWKIRINALKKEIESTENQLATAGNSDEKYRQKIKQNETQRAQAEREMRDMEELEKNVNGDDSSSELAERKRQAEQNHSVAKRLRDNALKDLANYRTKLEDEVKAKEGERSNLSARQNKFATRIARIDKDLVNIKDANSRARNEAARRNQERKMRIEMLSSVERSYLERYFPVREANRGRREHVKKLQLQYEALQRSLASVNGIMADSLDQGLIQPFPPSQSTPWNTTPHQAGFGGSSGVGIWPVANGEAASPLSGSNAARAPSIVSWQSSLVGTGMDINAKDKLRSSSMLGDVSGLTGPREGSGEEAKFLAYQRPYHQGRPSLGHGGTGTNGSSGSRGTRSGGQGSPV